MINDNDIIKVLNTKGSVVALKTDTVYGLVCNAYDIDAVNNIYKIKSREQKKPLSLFVKNIEEVNEYIKNLTPYCYEIMKKYWPGALTIIFEKKHNLFDYMTNNLDTIGIRIPNDKFLLNLLNNLTFPLAETSCNISGEDAYKSFEEIKIKFKNKIDLIVDGGEVVDNIPSTVISIINDKIKVFRNGKIDISGGVNG